MTNHPDTHAEDLSEEEKEKVHNKLIAAWVVYRTAICIKEHMDNEQMETNFGSLFKSKTCLTTPFQFDLDPKTMKEVAKITEKM